MELKRSKKAIARHTEAFKREIIELHLRTGESKSSLQRRYKIRGKSAITHWMGMLGYSEISGNISRLTIQNCMEVAKKSNPTTSIENLEARIKLLEKQLEDERLRSEMLNRMVDLAEKTYKIPVRKNSDTK